MYDSHELQKIYDARFRDSEAYRLKIWRTLIHSYFSQIVDLGGFVLDLGCGYGVFINQLSARQRYAMDLNPRTASLLDKEVRFFQQDCSTRWPLNDDSLDVVFTSNFFEHLPDKSSLERTLREVWRCLKPGGVIVAMGPNVRYLAGEYWDFWDHHLPLTERSLSEGLALRGFEITAAVSRFLPYKMTNAPKYPIWLLKLYFRLPWIWPLFGKQFLIVATKPADVVSNSQGA